MVVICTNLLSWSSSGIQGLSFGELVFPEGRPREFPGGDFSSIEQLGFHQHADLRGSQIKIVPKIEIEETTSGDFKWFQAIAVGYNDPMGIQQPWWLNPPNGLESLWGMVKPPMGEPGTSWSLSAPFSNSKHTR